MKGKSHFTKAEAREIEGLIKQKLKADSVKQKGIRDKIRRLGFYASDFGIRGGYTISDFRNVVNIGGKATTLIQRSIKSTEPKKVKTKPTKTKQKPSPKEQSDETYILDLCDEVLKLKGSRQHRFDFLRGDTGVKLPVDTYYPSLNLVIEYYERQHSESVPHFDKRITASGISRGEQRKLYDERRRVELPKNGVNLIVFNFAEFQHTSGKRLVREANNDLEVIKGRLKPILN